MQKTEKVETKTTFSKLFKKKEKIEEEPVIYLRTNGKMEVRYIIPEDGMYKIDNKVFHYRQGTDWELIEGRNRKKVKIVPEWGLYPLGSDAYLKELHGEEAVVQYDMIRAVQNAETVRALEDKQKTKINPKLAVLIIIGVIIALYFMMGK
jgi:hypothetical protein